MATNKCALIFGISGQDGAYLARLLLDKGYQVHGTSRDVDNRDFSALAALGALNGVHLHSASLLDFRNLVQVIDTVQPDEIYHLAGQSSVGLSFSQPLETMESTALGTVQVLEAIRYLGLPVRFYNAASSECFGQVREGTNCDESTHFHPRSPYAVAKSAAFWATANYREAYGLFACSGILFNHESPLRPKRFVTRKIVSSAVSIAKGGSEKLILGNLNVFRDWGYAAEYVDAMWRMLQADKAEDFVIATGYSCSLEDFVSRVFSTLSLDWREHVEINPSLFRPADIHYNCGNPAKARAVLGWETRVTLDQLIDKLVAHEMAEYQSQKP
ncbi:MAG: GDP-mannose 4,6-dehydratase [Mariprofundaceae bacterium]|nr:GDP-mannose 4,6-dehydratase [Mariprofundaceae bacterium]